MSFNLCPPFSKSASLPKFGLKKVLNHKKSENGYQIIRMDINYFLHATTWFYCILHDAWLFPSHTFIVVRMRSTDCIFALFCLLLDWCILKHLFPHLKLTKYILERHLNIFSYTHLPPIMGKSYWWIPMDSNWSNLDFPAERLPLLPGGLSSLGNFPVTILILILLADKSLQNHLAFYLSRNVHQKAR